MAMGLRNSVLSYLLLYNLVACVLWLYVFVVTVGCIADSSKLGHFFRDHLVAINIAQFVAIFEIFHSAVGFVSSPVSTVFVQVGSRFLVLFAVLNQIEYLQMHWMILPLLFAWSLSEVPRYLYYALNILSMAPYLLIWARYSLFLVLYPLGISSELFFIYKSLLFFKETDKWSIHMPNRFNFAFSFYSLLIWIIILYIPGSPHMYSHMCRQRSKYISPKVLETHKKNK